MLSMIPFDIITSNPKMKEVFKQSGDGKLNIKKKKKTDP